MQDLWWHEGLAEACAHLEMISFSVDPQWCGLLFSVYCSNEKGALFGGSSLSQHDAFAVCSLAGPPLNDDWITIAGSVGFEICRFSSSWTLILESGNLKASGVILLLGVGSLVCYRIYNHYWPQVHPKSSPCPQDPPQESEGQLVEDVEDGDHDELEARYFGPVLGVADECASLNTERSFPCSWSPSGSIHLNSSTSQSYCGTSGEDEGQDADVSESSQGDKFFNEVHSFENRHEEMQWSGCHSWVDSIDASNSGWLMDKINKILISSPDRLQLSGSAWLNFSSSPGQSLRLSHAETTKLGSNKEYYGWRCWAPEQADKQKQQGSTDCDSNGTSWTQSFDSGAAITRDESYDSLGFSKRMPWDGSFDSTCSELSFDFSLSESSVDVATGTMLCMEKLQQEIDQLKTNCLKMDEEFETIKCNRNLPGMSNLMKASTTDNLDANLDAGAISQESLKQEKARACFAGLYSLTSIKNSSSSELSDSFPAPVCDFSMRGSIGSAESLDWDSPKMVVNPTKHDLDELTEDIEGVSKLKVISSNLAESQLSHLISKKLLAAEDELMANLEWDEEDLLEYPEVMEESLIILDNEKAGNRSTIGSFTTESSKMESSSGFGSGSQMHDSCTSTQSDSPTRKSWTCWSSEESGCMEWDTTITSGMQNPPISTFFQHSEMERSSGFGSGSKMHDSYTSTQSNSPTRKSWTCWSSEELGCMEWDTTITSGMQNPPISTFSQHEPENTSQKLVGSYSPDRVELPPSWAS